MLFAIDFDTRTVESKATTTKSEELLTQYWFDNELENAVALVEDEDSLSLQFSLLEMEDLACGLTTNKKYEKFHSEELAAERCWVLLNNAAGEIPEFTKNLGKKLIRAAKKRCNEKPEKKTTKTKTAKPTVKKKSVSFTETTSFQNGDGQPTEKKHLKVAEFIEDNLGEVTYLELYEFLTTIQRKDPNISIKYSLNKNFIKEI